MTEPRRWPLGLASMLSLGFMCVELAVLALMAVVWIPAMRGMYLDFGGPLPAFTQLVMNPYWPAFWMLVLVAVAYAAVRVVTSAPRRRTLLMPAAGIGMVVVVMTWWGAQLPLFELASKIRA